MTKEFLVLCDDADDAPELRKKHLQEHLHYIESIMENIRVAGPLSEQRPDMYCGSCFIYTAENSRAALRLLFADPYYRNGVYRRWRIHEFRGVAGSWVGGRNW